MMYKNAFQILVWLLLLGSSFSAAAAEIGRWLLDEATGTAAVDSVGANNGIYRNGVSLAQDGPCGVAAGAARFDGSNDYIEIPHTAGYLLDSGTVSFWINPDRVSRGQRGVFSKDSRNYDDGGHLSMGTDRRRVWVRLQSRNRSYNLRSGNVLDTGEWTHVTVSWGSSGMFLFVDGVEVDNNSYSGGLGSNSGGSGNEEPIAIGADTGTSGDQVISPLRRYFDGSISDVRLFDSQLDSVGVASISQCPSVIGTLQAVADYRFDEQQWSGAANEVLDTAANGYHGQALSGANTSGDGVLCRAADFTASGTDRVSLNRDALNGLEDFTISVWGKTNASNYYQTIISGANASDANELVMLMDTSPRFYPGISIRYFSDASEISASSFRDNSWHHYVWTRQTAQNRSCFYFDGVLQGCSNHASSNDDDPLDIDAGGFILGQEQDSVGGGFDSSQVWNGLLDELVIFADDLGGSTITEIYNNQSGGLNWDGTARNCNVSARAEYRFDAASWNAVADEVVDSSGNGYHGVALATQPTEGKVCRAADFSDTTTADYISLNAGALDGIGDFTLTFWVKSAWFGNAAVLSGARSGQANELLAWFPGITTARPFVRGGSRSLGIISGMTPGDTWPGGVVVATIVSTWMGYPRDV